MRYKKEKKGKNCKRRDRQVEDNQINKQIAKKRGVTATTTASPDHGKWQPGKPLYLRVSVLLSRIFRSLSLESLIKRRRMAEERGRERWHETDKIIRKYLKIHDNKAEIWEKKKRVSRKRYLKEEEKGR